MNGFGSIVRELAALLAFNLLILYPAAAQVSTGEITGRILDSSGASVPEAKVTALNAATGLARTAHSNEAGEYIVTQLPPGLYEVSVEKEGFAKAVLKDIEVNVGTRQTLHFALRPGAITELVEVRAEAPLIESTKSELAGVVTPSEIQNLPLLNRTFAGLSIIMPEARPVGNFDPTKTRIGNFAMNGGDGRQLDVNVDGGDNKDNVVGSLLQNFAYEGIQEFQVLQHRWTAESGRAVGGVVNVVTKSGTNDLHGSFFANFRDEGLRRRDFFEKESTGPKSTFSRQEFGGSVGGPVVRDSLFFFGTIERFRERQDIIAAPTAVPQLSAIPGASPVPEIPNPYDDLLATGKMDYHLSSTQSLSARYSYQGNSSPNDQISAPARTDLTGGNTDDNQLHSFIANHTFTLDATKLNQFSFHYQNFDNKILGVTEQPNLIFPGNIQVGANTNVPQATSERKFQLRDDFSWHLQSHTTKFGFNYIHTKLGGFFFFGAKGYQVTFFDDPLAIRNNTNGLYPQGFATPGAVQNISFFDGKGDHNQTVHQLALYFQDDYKVTRKLTLNLGFRWDVNIGNLPDQTNNRTVRLLQRIPDPRAQAIAHDQKRLTRSAPSYKELQPRFGFAYDPKGNGRTVIRGGYGIFYDQIFQNLTLFSLTQTNPEIYQQVLNLVNSRVGEGQLATFRFGVDPLPSPPPGFTITELAYGGFGRINDPDMTEPYVQKFSVGFQHALSANWLISSDYVHTLGIHEPRVQVINPRIENICNPAYPGSNPASPLCVRGVNSRLFDRAFLDVGFPIIRGSARIEQINMIGTTNRSLFDSWTTQIRRRTRRAVFSLAYVLADSRSWGGQPVASYSGNPIQIAPENQFKPEEFGPTRLDERHRVVASGVFTLPGGVELSPILQIASSRPYSLNAGFDLDGDGLTVIDRICEGVNARTVFDVRGNSAAIRALNPPGCKQVQVNSQRKGFVVDAAGNVKERGGRFFNVDLRATKVFRFADRFNLRGYADFYNLFDTENLSFADRRGLSPATSQTLFMQPFSLYGPGFGPPVGRPLTVQLGLRLDF